MAVFVDADAVDLLQEIELHYVSRSYLRSFSGRHNYILLFLKFASIISHDHKFLDGVPHCFELLLYDSPNFAGCGGDVLDLALDTDLDLGKFLSLVFFCIYLQIVLDLLIV